jgi:hypothetical protein
MAVITALQAVVGSPAVRAAAQAAESVASVAADAAESPAATAIATVFSTQVLVAGGAVAMYGASTV